MTDCGVQEPWTRTRGADIMPPRGAVSLAAGRATETKLCRYACRRVKGSDEGMRQNTEMS